MSSHLQLKLNQIISELPGFVSEKSNNDNRMKVIKVEQNDLDEIISTKKSNSINKNKVINLKSSIKLHNYYIK